MAIRSNQYKSSRKRENLIKFTNLGDLVGKKNQTPNFAGSSRNKNDQISNKNDNPHVEDTLRRNHQISPLPKITPHMCTLTDYNPDN